MTDLIEGLTIAEICQLADISPPMVERALSSLVARGLIERVDGPIRVRLPTAKEKAEKGN